MIEEQILDPELPIIDAHHHLWFQSKSFIAATEALGNISAQGLARTFERRPRYLYDELLADLTSGHNIRATIYVEAHSMHRASGPERMRSVGEIEFANGIAAMAASKTFDDIAVCAAIVGGVDLQLGAAIEEVLHAHMQAGGGHYRGVRSSALYDEDAHIVGGGIPHLLASANFRAGFQRLHRLGLSFDALLLEPQMSELIDLARAFPDTQIVLNHLGGPVGVGRYAGLQEERFPIWRNEINTLATCQNVTVKLGGLGNPFGGFRSLSKGPGCTSAELAREWYPYIVTCIEAFGADRCMFESNFPVDSSIGSYVVVWNAFKRVVANASNDEKRKLFAGTAARVYRLDLDGFSPNKHSA